MPKPGEFRLRGREVSRVEAFSDVVFGFALTLIVISLEVPKTHRELMEDMRGGFLAFAICFAVLTWVWHEHHRFFRRYAMQDGFTVVLNSVLLFLVLFYVYPLKFLFSVVTGAIQPGPGKTSNLFIIYGGGFAGIFALLFLLYLHAYRRREELELNELEVFDTRTSMILYATYVAIGLLSVAIASVATRRWIGFAGWVYFLIGPLSGLIGYRRGVQRNRLHNRQVQSPQSTTNPSEAAAMPTVAADGP